MLQFKAVFLNSPNSSQLIFQILRNFSFFYISEFFAVLLLEFKLLFFKAPNSS
nr:MAG TPA: hypothetical protein [Caudoviricetes sp.]